MKYAKLINGIIRYAPKTVQWTGEDGQIHTVNNPSADKLLDLGYLPATRTDSPDELVEGKHYESDWKQTETEIVQTWHLVDDPVYPEPELTAEEALDIIVGGTV